MQAACTRSTPLQMCTSRPSVQKLSRAPLHGQSLAETTPVLHARGRRGSTIRTETGVRQPPPPRLLSLCGWRPPVLDGLLYQPVGCFLPIFLSPLSPFRSHSLSIHARAQSSASCTCLLSLVRSPALKRYVRANSALQNGVRQVQALADAHMAVQQDPPLPRLQKFEVKFALPVDALSLFAHNEHSCRRHWGWRSTTTLCRAQPNSMSLSTMPGESWGGCVWLPLPP